MEVIITQEDQKSVVKLIGRLDTITASALEKDVTPLLTPQANVVFDCSELAYISSSGLRIVLMTHKKLSSIGGTLTMENVGPEIKSIFDMTGFSSILHFA